MKAYYTSKREAEIHGAANNGNSKLDSVGPILVPLSHGEFLVQEIQHTLTPAECKLLIEAGAGKWQKSRVGQGHMAKTSVIAPGRSSSTAWLPVDSKGFIGDVVRKVRGLTAKVTGVRDWSLYEPELQLVRYEEHEQYKAHFDKNSAAAHSALATVLIYLNDDYCGGQTHFPALDLVVTPVEGNAIVWRTQFDKAGRPNKKAEHAGLPVTCGIKYIATQWVDLPV
eukprot:SM000180S03510  [mRNA]  locus=s180:234945:235990:- [translate_table: standard]